MSKKILYILTKSDLGGVSKYLLEITKGLPQNITPYYVMSSEGYFSEELLKLGISNDQIFFVQMTNSIIDIKTHLKSNLETLKIIKQIKPNLIHCNSTTGGIIGRVCGVLTKTPVIFTAHGWAFTNGICLWKRVFYKILETILAILTKKIICVSEYDMQIGIKTMPFYKNKMTTIHNGITDIPEEYKKNKFSENELRIVMISRFCQQKDPYTLIMAVNELNKEGYSIKLDLYGYGEELDKVLNCIESQSNENIQYQGEINDVTPILKNYDVYALISNWEGLPIGIIEAMRTKLPVIVCDVGGNSEVVIDNKNGFVITRQDKIALKEKIKLYYNDRNLLQQFGLYGEELYKQLFSNEKMVQQTMETYGDVLCTIK